MRKSGVGFLSGTGEKSWWIAEEIKATTGTKKQRFAGSDDKQNILVYVHRADDDGTGEIKRRPKAKKRSKRKRAGFS